MANEIIAAGIISSSLILLGLILGFGLLKIQGD